MSKKKLIEVALPLEEINRQSSREKSIRKGHPSTLHLWWARRPLATARAVLFSQLVDDPSARYGDFLEAARAAGESDPEAVARARVEAERRRLFTLITRMVNWDNIGDEHLLREVREEIRSGFASQGASVTDVESRYGDELLVDMPMRMPDGRSGTSRMRIIGREGDRWFARIDVLGPAAASPEAGAHIEKVIDRIVVRRDKHPRTRLELLPLHVPGGAAGVKRA